MREDFDVIVDANPLAGADERRLGETEHHHLNGRPHEQQSVNGDEWPHQDQGRQIFRALVADHVVSPPAKRWCHGRHPEAPAGCQRVRAGC
ncbi:hypothetical protein D3C87_1922890 [compost metagenome]